VVVFLPLFLRERGQLREELGRDPGRAHLVAIQIVIPLLNREREVRFHEGDAEEELAILVRVEEGEGFVGGEVLGIFFDGPFRDLGFLRQPAEGVVLLLVGLALVGRPGARGLKARIAPVGLAEPDGAMAGVDEEIGERGDALVFLIRRVAKRGEVGRHSPAYERHARRHANGILAVGRREAHAGRCERIERGRFHERIAGAAHDARVVLVAHQEEHVVAGRGAFRAACGRESGQREEAGDQEQAGKLHGVAGDGENA
jgi:hypothetical protein